MENAKNLVLRETTPQQFVEKHFDSIFKEVKTRLGGESNLKDDRNELKKLCANYIQNLNDQQKNPNTKDKKVEITKKMRTILDRIDSKYQSSKSKPGSSGSTPKTTSLQTGVVKQAAQKLEAFIAQQTEIDQSQRTVGNKRKRRRNK